MRFITVVGKNLNHINKNFSFASKKTFRGPDQQSYFFDNNILCCAQTLKITKRSQFSDQPYKIKMENL